MNGTQTKRRVHPRLASARAYWRLAAKSRRNGNWTEGAHWQSVGDKFYRMYQRDRMRTR